MLLIFILGVILSSVSPIIKPSLYCLEFIEDVCYVCNSFIHNLQCIRMSNQIKIIHTDYNTDIDILEYVNMNIMIVEERSRIVFFPCDNRTNYLQVTSNCYYPINKRLNFRDKPLGNFTHLLRTHFQPYLDLYCYFQNNNRFLCNSDLIDTLDFVFSSLVTLNCIQNITYAHIASNGLTELRPNVFFQNAYNLIALEMVLENVTYVHCNAFKSLLNLRVLYLFLGNSKLEDYQCIFNYAPNLMQIQTPIQRIWRSCKNSESKNCASNHKIIITEPIDSKRLSNDVLCFSALFILIIDVILILCFFLMYHKRRRTTQMKLLRFKSVWFLDDFPKKNCNSCNEITL